MSADTLSASADAIASAVVWLKRHRFNKLVDDFQYCDMLGVLAAEAFHAQRAPVRGPIKGRTTGTARARILQELAETPEVNRGEKIRQLAAENNISLATIWRWEKRERRAEVSA